MRDLKPLVERNETNGFSKSEQVRDSIYDAFVQAAAREQVDVLILKSPPFISPPWVKVECWNRHQSEPSLTVRSSAVLEIRSMELHRFPFEIDLVVSDDTRTRTWRSITTFGLAEATSVLQYLLCKTQSRKFGLRQCRTWPFQVWRTKNKPDRLGHDPVAITTQAFLTIGFLTIGFGIGFLLMIVAGIVAYYGSKRRRHVLSAGKPSQEPRHLIRLDSWQTLVREVGSDRAAVTSAIQCEMSKAASGNFVICNEKIWYWGVDGKEEREQLVVRFRRGIAFIHVYEYGDDLFVGWDAHVNCGTWIEMESRQGYDKTTSELCVVNTIAPGWHVPNEYDLTDTNCLIERVHSAVTRVIKKTVVDHNIDQEIDFTILREQRQSVVGRRDTSSTGVQNVLSKFRRLG